MTRFKNMIIFLLTAVLIFTAGSITSPKASAASDITRLAGEDRYSTAVKIAQQGWGGSGSDNVVLATGNDYPDALCAAPLAKELNAPILLTDKLSLRKDVYDEIDALGAENIYMIGGPGVISADIESTLKNDGKNVIRLYGEDRYATSLKVADYMVDELGMNITGVMVTTGKNFPDALSAAPVAAVKGMPILLSPGDSMTDGLLQFVNSRGVQDEYVIGGPGVISGTAMAELPNPERIWGGDRYETNSSVIYRFKDVLNFDKSYVATGEDFPDALAGSALAPLSSSPVILTYKDPAPSTVELLNMDGAFINDAYALGGTGVVSDKTLNSLFEQRVNTEGNSLSNLNNFGIASVQDGWIYYSDYSDNQNLYKMKPDGSSVTKLSSEGGISHINVLGDFIYYSSNEGKLSKMSIQGTDSTVLVDDEVYFLYAASDWIYFYSKGALQRMKPDGSDRSTILESDDQWNYYITDGYIYYIENGSLMRVNSDGSGKTAIINGNVQYFNISGGSIYYISLDQKLYKAVINGTGKKLLTNDDTGSINVTDGFVYYSNISDNSTLYKVSVDGTSRVKLGSTSIYGDINVVGDRIFCSSGSESYAINAMNSDGNNNTVIGNGMGYSFRFGDGWMYYVNITDNDHINRVRTDGTGWQSFDAVSSGEIDLSGGWIYYSNGDDNNSLYKISIDGTANQKVLDHPVGDFKVSGSMVYYSDMADDSKLYSVNMDNPGQSTKLTDNPARNITVDSGWVYYFDEGTFIKSANGEEVPSGYGIYRVAGDGSSSPTLLNQAYIDSMDISDGYLFFHDVSSNGGGEVFRANLDGTGSIPVTGSSLGFAVDGGYIYSLDNDNEKIIHKYDLNGSEVQSYNLAEPGYYICADSGRIYFETFQDDIYPYNISIFGK